MHGILAGMASIPELQLSEEEGMGLASAIANVQQHYGGVLDPKTEAWIGLGLVAGALYVPRVIAIRARLKHENEAPPRGDENSFM